MKSLFASVYSFVLPAPDRERFCCRCRAFFVWPPLGCVVLRGTKVNRTYGTHKNLYISLFLLTIFGPTRYLLFSPVIFIVAS